MDARARPLPEVQANKLQARLCPTLESNNLILAKSLPISTRVHADEHTLGCLMRSCQLPTTIKGLYSRKLIVFHRMLKSRI